jgi:hypothetical protein
MIGRAFLIVAALAGGVAAAEAKGGNNGFGANHGASTFTPSYQSRNSAEAGAQPPSYYAPGHQSRNSADTLGPSQPPSYYAPGQQFRRQ